MIDYGTAGGKTMTEQPQFQSVFERLRAILTPYASRMVVRKDTPQEYYLDGYPTLKSSQGMFFASVKVNRKYVSFYLMPVYVFPDLLGAISSGLRQRMQGKSCFNFKQMDEALFNDLEILVRRGAVRYQQEHMI
jgi:hypothetical protein